MDNTELTRTDAALLAPLRRQTRNLLLTVLPPDKMPVARRYMQCRAGAAIPLHDSHGLLTDRLTMQTALLFAEQVEPDASIITAILLAPYVSAGLFSPGQIAADWGDDAAMLVGQLLKVKRFSNVGINADPDNFRSLLLSLAEDIRVIIIMIVENLALMRLINLHPDTQWVNSVSFQANCLYGQLAHRLGLYAIKGELEDLSLKYTNRTVYKQIATRLKDTKRKRDAYIEAFVEPVRRKLSEAGLKFDIKARTKSISSIWAKIRRQKVDINGIFDLFAIRVIIDTPKERETRDCWLAYSIVADMYPANPARMRDWLSVPKSNGYESLHATVMGPDNKWVEVQFRSRRMDLVAEKGLAAHWRYKGGKADVADRWMNNVRDILESAEEGPMSLMKDMRLDIYGREVFAFTPKGALLRLPAGATVLDFAFQVHTAVGSKCTGAIVNGKHQKITYKVKNGDTVEVVTSSGQSPKQDWLNVVTTSKARNKIRQSLNEARTRKAELGKEMMERRARNRKIELDDALMMKLVRKSGYKALNDFFADMADEKVDAGKFLAKYIALLEEMQHDGEPDAVSAGEFEIREKDTGNDGDVITIGNKSLRGMNYRFAKCCNPLHGDPVFGFVSSDGLVKVHRYDCPNAANIRSRYPYRLIKVQWSDNVNGTRMPVTIQVVGTDDIGIVSNMTSIIAKDPDTDLRNISIDSHDGIFRGFLGLAVASADSLKKILSKLRTVKGVKNIERV